MKNKKLRSLQIIHYIYNCLGDSPENIKMPIEYASEPNDGSKLYVVNICLEKMFFI